MTVPMPPGAYMALVKAAVELAVAEDRRKWEIDKPVVEAVGKTFGMSLDECTVIYTYAGERRIEWPRYVFA